MRWFMIIAVFLLTNSWTSVGRTGEDGHAAHCPRCRATCYPTVTKGTEEKQCWEVETKTICIPKVRFPWETKCCNKGCGKDGCVPPKCGRTKYVNVLVPHKYECSTCKYSWDVDGDKYDNGKIIKTYGPTEAAPTAAEPPPAEASLQSNRRAEPAGFEQSDHGAPAKRSYVEVLTSFFKGTGG